MAFGRRRIEGETGWSRVTLTPGERRSVAARLGRRELLTITPTSRRRLREWLDSPRAAAQVETWEQRRGRLIRELVYYGDLEALPTVAAALASAPRPVSDYVVAECVVILTGRTTAGWTTGRLPARWPITLCGAVSDEQLRFYTLHEVGHRWTLPDPVDAAPTAVEIARATLKSREMGWDKDVAALRAEGEDHADMLAHAWLAEETRP